MRPDGNTILVTGGGSGIGRALARRFHDDGNTVIVAGRRREALDGTIGDRAGMTAVVLDIADAGAIAAFARRIIRHSTCWSTTPASCAPRISRSRATWPTRRRRS